MDNLDPVSDLGIFLAILHQYFVTLVHVTQKISIGSGSYKMVSTPGLVLLNLN